MVNKVLIPFSIILFSIALVIGLWFLIQVGYHYPSTGFGTITYTKQPNQEIILSKTLWDWLGLLIIPIGIALSASLFAWLEKRNEGRITDERAQDAALEEYLKQMGTLLLDKDLGKPSPKNEVLYVARAWTLTVLSRVKRGRKGVVLRFLYESGLIATNIVSLMGADLREAILREADLSGANLREAILVGANLSEANLKGAILDNIKYSDSTTWPEGFDPKATGAKPVSNFLTEAAVREQIEKSNKIQPGEEVRCTLLLFETAKQHTWLVSTDKQLFCIVDDEKRRAHNELIRWNLGLDKATPVKATENYRPGKGLVDIGERTDWPYSHHLYGSAKKVEDEINKMISDSQKHEARGVFVIVPKNEPLSPTKASKNSF